jgi:hypothetical protein
MANALVPLLDIIAGESEQPEGGYIPTAERFVGRCAASWSDFKQFVKEAGEYEAA